MEPIGVTIDEAQARIKQPMMSIGADGRSWDFYTSTNFFVDPITLTGMIRPFCLTPQWETTATGGYARFRASDYRTVSGGALSPNNWIENDRRCAGDVYLEGLSDTQAQPVYTPTTAYTNQGYMLSFYVPEGGDFSRHCLEFGWGEVEAAQTVSVRVFAGGQAEVWKTFYDFSTGFTVTRKVGDYSISGLGNAEQQQNLADSTPLGDLSGKTINLYVLPCRRRELLVFGTGGGGFSHVFADLPANIINNITPAGRFWWRVPVGKASVQCAPMLFPASAVALSPVLNFREPPAFGSGVGITTYYDPPLAGQTTFTASLDANPNGANTGFRIRHNLTSAIIQSTGIYRYTGFLYATWAEFGATTATTANVPKNIAPYVSEVRLSVGTEATGVSAKVRLKPGADAAPASAIGANIGTRFNRPVRLTVGTKTILGGVSVQPAKTFGATLLPSNTLEMEIIDGWHFLENAVYLDNGAAFDGLTLTDTINLLLDHAQWPAGARDIEASTFALDITGGASRGEVSYAPKIGDSVATWLSRLHKDFAWSWFMGIVPTATGPVFRFRSEATLSAVPKATIYMNRGGVVGRLACRQLRVEEVAPEATRISVVGYDPRLKRVLRAGYTNTGIENAGIVLGDWVGEVRAVGLVEPRLTTATGVGRARDSLVERLTKAQKIGEWESDFLTGADGVPVWRGDVVRIVGSGDYRVLSFGGLFRRVTNLAGWGLQRFNYAGKWIGAA